MRDIFLVLCFPIFIWFAFRSPYTSLNLWLWTSMYPLHNWVYGIALSLRYNLVFAVITIFGYVFLLKDKPAFRITGLFVVIVLFYLHVLTSTIVNAFLEHHWAQFTEYSKSFLFFIFCILMLRTKEHFTAILSFIALSICYFGLIEGLKYISSGGGHIIYGMRGPLGDNNKVALGLNMCIPLLIYLISVWKHKKIFKWFHIGLLCVCIIAILGTNSRGGLLALLFLAAYYWWINGKRVSVLFSVAIIIFLVLNLMPESWLERMNSIQTASVDNSFMHRVTFWKINVLAALDNPLLGVGFDSTSVKVIWQEYAYQLHRLNWGIETSLPERGFVAHSIYFQVLGNQGVLGLLLFLSIIVVSFRTVNDLCKHSFKIGEWQYQLLLSVKVSLIAFCVAGAALNAAYFELLYLMFAIIICLKINSLTNYSSIEQPES